MQSLRSKLYPNPDLSKQNVGAGSATYSCSRMRGCLTTIGGMICGSLSSPSSSSSCLRPPGLPSSCSTSTTYSPTGTWASSQYRYKTATCLCLYQSLPVYTFFISRSTVGKKARSRHTVSYWIKLNAKFIKLDVVWHIGSDIGCHAALPGSNPAYQRSSKFG